jgi:glutathione synthase/RimK-type ligase-like ATP-grasp enzyme
MKALFVVNAEGEWPHDNPGVALVTAKDYLTGTGFNSSHHRQVVNLCRFDRAQGEGYYVSLLAEARGQQALPAARTIEDLRGTPATSPVLKQVAERVQHSLPQQEACELSLYSYFGIDPDGGHALVAHALFAALKVPLLRADFRNKAGRWRLTRVQALSVPEVPEAHREALLLAATQFASGQPRPRAAARDRPAIAILHTPGEPLPPSNPAALEKFLRAAQALGMSAEIVQRDALDRLAQFDALFIRDTTYLKHYTYQFAQRAAALGLVVIDDADSILQCNNKVYLNELFGRHGIPTPRTLMVHRDNLGDIAPALGLPCILKQPDGGFSLGVRKASSEGELRRLALSQLEKSELIIAQEFLPTQFDWRVTVLDRRPLFVCQYFMAPDHWQVHKYERGGHTEGDTAALSVGETPELVVKTALRAASLIGDGLYGVDLKQVGTQCYVIEINDNPNVDAGNEDGVLKDALYREVMGVFFRRITERQPELAQ